MGKKNKTPEKKREWADVNEDVKFVCQGGKVQCQFAAPPIADIVVTSNTVMLQDKPFATIKDKDGKVNFNFTGVCNHPSQQKPFSPPPPCKSIISLGEWKDYSETKINEDNALLVKSTIPCMISSQDLKIIHSGQMAVLTRVEPKMKREPKITNAYWIDDSEKRISLLGRGDKSFFIIETEDYNHGDELMVTFKWGNEVPIMITTKVDTHGVAKIRNPFTKL